MSLIPQYRFELYKKVGEKDHSVTPILVNGFNDISYRGGIETTKDIVSIKFSNQRVNGSAYNTFLGKANREDNVFGIDDEIKLYFYYAGSEPTDIDDALILSGRIASFSYNPSGDNNIYTLKINNRTEELLNTMTPFSTRFNTGSANTSPTAIKSMINRLNKFNSSKEIFAGLTTDTIEVTGSPGNIQALNSSGGAFPTIDYNETWKPIFFNIEKLSSPEYTGDENVGEYIFYVKYTKVLPQFQKEHGKTVNEIVWKSKSLVSSGSLSEGKDITNISISLDLKEIQNLLIVNAGTDARGAGITGVAYDLDSIGKFGTKAGYYTKSRRVFSELRAQEERAILNANGSMDVDGLPSDSEFPYTMSFQDRDSLSGSFNGDTLIATSKKDWNQYLRDEARWQAVLEANKILERLGEPKYNLSADLIVGSSNIIQGDIYNFVVPSYGWEGTATNPAYKLRIRQTQHTLGRSGWSTRIEAKEDEKTISESLGNVRGNI